MSKLKKYSIDYKIDGLTGEEIKELARKFKEEHGRGALLLTYNTFQKLEKEYDLFENKEQLMTKEAYKAKLKGTDILVKTSIRVDDDVIKLSESAYFF